MATGEDLGFFDYVKAAFRFGPRIRFLGRMPFNYLGLAAFGVLGIVSPAFWFLGAAAEVSYLALLSSNPRFQSLVRGEKMLAAKESHEDRVRKALERLTPASQKRYQQLLARCREIQGISETLEEYSVAGIRSRRTGSLSQLLWIFLRLLTSHDLLQDSIERVNRGEVEREIEDLEARILAITQSGTQEALRRSLEGTLEIQRKRLLNLQNAEQSLEVVRADLKRIEKQVVLLREESVVSGKAEFLSSRLDEVAGMLSETNRWMEQNAEIFGRLGVDPLGSAPEDLPEIPQALDTEES